jgi:hypothetical protein
MEQNSVSKVDRHYLEKNLKHVATNTSMTADETSRYLLRVAKVVDATVFLEPEFDVRNNLAASREIFEQEFKKPDGVIWTGRYYSPATSNTEQLEAHVYNRMFDVWTRVHSVVRQEKTHAAD